MYVEILVEIWAFVVESVEGLRVSLDTLVSIPAIEIFLAFRSVGLT